MIIIIINAENTLFLTTYVTQLTRVHATMDSLPHPPLHLSGKFQILLLSLSDVPVCGECVCVCVCVQMCVCPNVCMCEICVSTCAMDILTSDYNTNVSLIPRLRPSQDNMESLAHVSHAQHQV